MGRELRRKICDLEKMLFPVRFPTCPEKRRVIVAPQPIYIRQTAVLICKPLKAVRMETSDRSFPKTDLFPVIGDLLARLTSRPPHHQEDIINMTPVSIPHIFIPQNCRASVYFFFILPEIPAECYLLLCILYRGRKLKAKDIFQINRLGNIDCHLTTFYFQ